MGACVFVVKNPSEKLLFKKTSESLCSNPRKADAPPQCNPRSYGVVPGFFYVKKKWHLLHNRSPAHGIRASIASVAATTPNPPTTAASTAGRHGDGSATHTAPPRDVRRAVYDTSAHARSAHTAAAWAGGAVPNGGAPTRSQRPSSPRARSPLSRGPTPETCRRRQSRRREAGRQ